MDRVRSGPSRVAHTPSGSREAKRDEARWTGEREETTREASNIVSERAWVRERENSYDEGWRRTKERRIDRWIEKRSERAGMTR